MDNNTNPLLPYIELLPKFTNYVVSGTLLCYLSGFAITNMYIGSLGIVNLDVLRTKYILVGLLFSLFICAILYLIYDLFRLFQTIPKYTQISWIKLVLYVIWHLIQNLVILYLAVSAISIFSGPTNSPTIGIPNSSLTIPWGEWLAIAPISALVVLASLLLLIILTLAIPAFLVMAIKAIRNSKAAKDSQNKKTLKQKFVAIFENTKKLTGIVLGISIIGYIYCPFAENFAKL